MKAQIRKILAYIGIIAAFLAIAYGYCPQVLDGKIVNQSDISGYKGMAQETNDWNTAHPDDPTAWSDSMFGGMPNVMISANEKGDWTQWMYDFLLLGRRPATYLFLSLLGAFLLMLALGAGPLASFGGAVAITFCSYNMQIIQVGHNSKMLALAFAPWVLAAVVFTYKCALNEYEKKRRWLPLSCLGAALFGMALNFQIKANHIQISYYLAIIILTYALTLLVHLCASKERRARLGRFFAASALLLSLGIAGIGVNAGRLIPTYKYTAHTMRGGSELGQKDNAKTKGLDLQYATAWSYGWEELPNMLIPNFNGGASAGPVNPNKSATIEILRQAGQGNLKQTAKALPMYWGPQPFTAGPMYMGCITIFLFVLGLGLLKGKDKWWMLIPSIIGICLAVGYHFMPFTKFWYYNVPFYSKFRTVSMALVILQLTLPMLGFLALDAIMKAKYSAAKIKTCTLVSLGITGGFCLLCWLIPDIAGSFVADSDAGQHELLAEAFMADRRMLLRGDALMSFLFIAAAALLILWSSHEKEDSKSLVRKYMGAAAVVALVLINMVSVGKRYLNSDHFITPRQFNSEFVPRPVDKAILEDEEPSYRVLDLTVDVFNSSRPSCHHKNIGGYSPVKLQRYQDLIDRYLSREIRSFISVVNEKKALPDIEESMPEMPALNMLNTKYMILGGELPPVENFNRLGECWPVGGYVAAASPDEEISLLGSTDLSLTAIIGDDFAWAREKMAALLPCQADVHMVSYAPNQLVYQYSAESDIAVIFSEIYYPEGWSAHIEDSPVQGRYSGNGAEVELFRADWILRGAILPAGEHYLVMRFDPPSYKIGSGISRASSLLLFLLIILSAGFAAKGLRKEEA